MDFLDPKKQKAHRIRLMVGYALLAVAVALAATVLLYQAHGFGVKQGKVIQNGLVFVNSAPGPAVIDLDGRRADTTNARLVLEAGSYTMRLSRQGYHDWQRALTVEGGSVEHFSYPLLIPRELKPAVVGTYQAVPGLMTQSPDRRWLLVQQTAQAGAFDVYDTDDPEQAPPKLSAAIPAALFGLPPSDARPLEVVEWSNNNTHVLLRHGQGAEAEYIVFNHREPAESVNLTRTLQLTPNLIPGLQDKKHDRYFIHDMTAKTLSVATLSDPQSLPLLTGVLAYKAYGNDTVLYSSPLPPAAGQPATAAEKVQLKLFQDKKQYNLRTVTASDTYLLGLSRYDGDWLAMAGVPSEGRVYIYRDPAAALRNAPTRVPVPAAVLKVANPTNVAFSANSQLLMAQAPAADGSGVDFAVYDAEYDRSHTYRMDAPLDLPQTKALWVDSHHLQYVSGGKVLIFDYDGTNRHALSAQSPAVPALFDTGYVTVYTAVPASGGSAPALSSTSLRLPADL